MVLRGRQHRQEKPQPLPGAEEIQGFPSSHLPLSCNQTPGAHLKMLIPQPSQGGWDRAQESVCLQLPKSQTSNPGRRLPCCLQGPGQPASVSQALCLEPPCRGPLPVLLVPGSRPLADPPWVMPYRGPASSNPGALCLALPPLPLIRCPPAPKPTVPMAFVPHH